MSLIWTIWGQISLASTRSLKIGRIVSVPGWQYRENLLDVQKRMVDWSTT